MAYIHSHDFRRDKLLMENLKARLPDSPYYLVDSQGNLTHYTYTKMFCDAVFFALCFAAIAGLLYYNLYGQGLVT